MKYVKSGDFTTQQMGISETITETTDVICIANDIIKKIADSKNCDPDELKLASNNLTQAIHYLEYIKNKTNIALQFVPKNIQETEYL